MPAGWPAFLLFLTVIGACDVPTGLPQIESRYRFPVESLAIPVTGVAATATASQDLSGIESGERVRGATLRISPANPSGATGTVTFRITGGGVSVTGSVDVARPSVQLVELNEAEARALLGGTVEISGVGALCRASGCALNPPPFPEVTLENEIELLIHLVGEG